MTVMSLFAYGLENNAEEMTAPVGRPQLAAVMHRSIKTIGRKIALAKILGLLKSESKGKYGEYVVSQKPGHYVVPVDEITRWAKGRESKPIEVRNAASPATVPSEEDAQLRNSRGGELTGTPIVPDAVSPLQETQQGQESGQQGHEADSTGTQKGFNRDNMVSHSGVLPSGLKELSGVDAGPDGPAVERKQTTEASSSDSTGEWSVTSQKDSKSNPLLIQAKKPELPKCAVCHWKATNNLPEKDGEYEYCREHDTEAFRGILEGL